MISAAVAAKDYRPTKRDWVLIGREAQRAGEQHTVPMGSCHALPKLNCQIKRDQLSPFPPTGCREMIQAFLRQWRNEDCFIKRDLPPMARPHREQFQPETKVASDHQPPKATEAAVRRRLRTSTQTRSAQTKVTDWIEACGRRRTDICLRRAASAQATPWPSTFAWHQAGRRTLETDVAGRENEGVAGGMITQNGRGSR